LRRIQRPLEAPILFYFKIYGGIPGNSGKRWPENAGIPAISMVRSGTVIMFPYHRKVLKVKNELLKILESSE
jgi:hypothetical protein